MLKFGAPWGRLGSTKAKLIRCVSKSHQLLERQKLSKCIWKSHFSQFFDALENIPSLEFLTLNSEHSRNETIDFLSFPIGQPTKLGSVAVHFWSHLLNFVQKMKWGVSLQWTSSLYCPIRHGPLCGRKDYRKVTSHFMTLVTCQYVEEFFWNILDSQTGNANMSRNSKGASNMSRNINPRHIG